MGEKLQECLRKSNSEQRAYSVQGRFVGGEAKTIGEQTFTDRWQRISMKVSPQGVPSGNSRLDFAAEYYGLVNYQSAQALRWWFHALLQQEHIDMCFETRIVEHLVKYSLEETQIEAHEVMGNSDGLDRKTQRTCRPKATE